MQSIFFVNHYKELKYRVYYIIFTIILTFLVAYHYAIEIFYILINPLINLEIKNFNYSLIYTDISEAFFTYLKISLFITFLVTINLFIGHIIKFISPGLYKKEFRFIKNLYFYFFIIFIFSSLFFYFIFMPILWYFFISSERESSTLLINLSFEGRLYDYLNISLTLFKLTSLLAIYPIFLYLFVYFNILKISFLIKERKIAILFFLIVGGFLSPPDIISQLLIALPMLLLYEVIIFIILYKNDYNK